MCFCKVIYKCGCRGNFALTAIDDAELGQAFLGINCCGGVDCTKEAYFGHSNEFCGQSGCGDGQARSVMTSKINTSGYRPEYPAPNTSRV